MSYAYFEERWWRDQSAYTLSSLTSLRWGGGRGGEGVSVNSMMERGATRDTAGTGEPT